MRRKGQEFTGEERLEIHHECRRLAREEVNRAGGICGQNPKSYPALPISHWFARVYYFMTGEDAPTRTGSSWLRGSVIFGEDLDDLIREDRHLANNRMHALMWCLIPGIPNRVASAYWAREEFEALLKRSDYKQRFEDYTWQQLLGAVFTFHTGGSLEWITPANDRQYRSRIGSKISRRAAADCVTLLGY